MDDDRAAEPAGDRQLGLEGRLLEAEREFRGYGLLRQVEAVEPALAYRDRGVGRSSRPERLNPRDRRLPSPDHGAGMDPDGVADAIPVLARDLTVEVPVG